jgi:hypothetical protein
LHKCYAAWRAIHRNCITVVSATFRISFNCLALRLT